MSGYSRREFLTGSLVAVWGGARFVQAAEQPANLRQIGGAWHVSEGPQPIYCFHDDGRYVDLFSYHQKDSNGDGIPNLRMRHESIV